MSEITRVKKWALGAMNWHASGIFRRLVRERVRHWRETFSAQVVAYSANIILLHCLISLRFVVHEEAFPRALFIAHKPLNLFELSPHKAVRNIYTRISSYDYGTQFSFDNVFLKTTLKKVKVINGLGTFLRSEKLQWHAEVCALPLKISSSI